MKRRTEKKRAAKSKRWARHHYVHDRGCVVCFQNNGSSYMTKSEWDEWASNGPIQKKHRPRPPESFWPDDD
jgi:hypothetical protein